MSGLNSAHYLPHTASYTELDVPAHVKNRPTYPAWIWVWEALPLVCALNRGRCQETFGPPLPTLTLDWLSFKFLWSSFIARNPQAWSGLKACGGITVPVFAPSSGRNRVTH